MTGFDLLEQYRELHEEEMNKNLDKYESEMNENERIK